MLQCLYFGKASTVHPFLHFRHYNKLFDHEQRRASIVATRVSYASRKTLMQCNELWAQSCSKAMIIVLS
jgi:hypothetical protein